MRNKKLLLGDTLAGLRIVGVSTSSARVKTMKKAVFFSSCLTVLLLTVAMALPSQYAIPNVETVIATGLEVYEDINCTQPMSQIEWGLLEPNETAFHVCHVKSVSNVNSTLKLATQNWNPVNSSDYLILSWNYDNSTLQPNEVLEVTFNLHVDSEIRGITSFSSDMILTTNREYSQRHTLVHLGGVSEVYVQQPFNEASYVIGIYNSTPYYVWNSTTEEYRLSTNANDVIQSAINALTNGGTIFIKAGTYRLTNTLYLKDNIALKGEGQATVLKLDDNINKTMIYLDSNAKYCMIQDLKLDGNAAHNSEGHGIYFYHTEWLPGRATVKNVHVWNTAKHGIYILHYAGVILESVRCFYNGESGIKVCSNDNFISNTYIGWSDKSCLVIKGSHNNVVNIHTWGGGYSNPSSGLGQSGIVLYGHRNTIVGSQSESNCRIGILIQGGSRNVISGCLVWNNGKQGFPSGRGIGIAGDAKYNIISQNYIYDYRDTKYQELAVNEIGTSDYNQIVNNDFSLNPSPTIQWVGEHTVVAHNTGFVTENSGTANNLANGGTITHGLARTPTAVTLACLNATYDGELVLVYWDEASTDSTNISVDIYWVNGTAITTGIIDVSWSAKYKP